MKNFNLKCSFTSFYMGACNLAPTWNRRHREYTLKVKTGSLLEIADVLRQLLLLKMIKKLSFGEKKMLDQCKELIVKEISLSSGSPEGEVSEKIDSIYT